MNIRKVLLFTAVLLLLIGFISSCKKCYTCANLGMQYGKFCTNDYTPAQLTALDSSCVQSGEVWSIYSN